MTMTEASNMAPGSEHDPRSGCDDDTIDCPECNEGAIECHYCDGAGVLSERHYKDIKSQEREETEANQ